MMSGMAKNKQFDFKIIEDIPNDEMMQALLHLYKTIFDDAKPDFFIQRLHEKEHVLSLVAFHNEKPIAFKIGYKYDETTFYSWVGGVLQEYRKQGIARHLAKIQEGWAKKHGYSKLRTKSMNRFKGMLILNLKNGFDIKQVYTNDNGQTKIIFEKEI